MTMTMRSLVIAGAVWAAMCVAALGQVTTRNPGTYPPSPNVPGMNDPMNDPRVPNPDKRISEKMAISRNDERQKKLVADTNQLFDLASKLKDEVDKTDKYTLSLDVVKRTAEIEKLAKSIRERMKD
jgi:hypothetical protein